MPPKPNLTFPMNPSFLQELKTHQSHTKREFITSLQRQSREGLGVLQLSEVFMMIYDYRVKQ